MRPRPVSAEFSDIRLRLNFDPAYPAPNIPASWNVCPTDPMLVVIQRGRQTCSSTDALGLAEGEDLKTNLRWGSATLLAFATLRRPTY